VKKQIQRTDTEKPEPPSGISMPNHERNEDVSYVVTTEIHRTESLLKT